MAKNQKHPKGLMILFFTEMWERFGYYLMLGIFSLYMIEPTSSQFAGLGFTNMYAADIYGTYLALVYLTPFFGGLIADRFIGYRKSILIGGVLMAAGYIGLSIPNSMIAFYIALLLIILGNGMFKPNVSVLLGKLYEKPEYESLKDSGYNIFYMGINIGAFVCNFVAAYLRLTYGWGWAFAAAGIGMIIGVIWFMIGLARVPEIKEADKISPKRPNDISMARIFSVLFLPAFAAAALGWFIPNNIFGSDSTDAFIFFCIPVILFFFTTWKSADKKTEREPIAALLAVFGVVIIFWAVFHQNGSALTYWAKNNTSREVKGITESVINTVAKVEEVSTVPRTIQLQGLHGEDLGSKTGPNPYFDNYTKDLPTGNIDGKPGDVNDEDWSRVPKQELPKYGKINLWPTELQASINPFFVVVLTPLVVMFFGFLRRRKKEPTTPGKIAWGMLISALSWLVMVWAAIASGNGISKASVAWLFGVYGVITIGELCLSPMGLSLVSKLAPKRIAALMMGGWFLSTAIGNKLSGVLSGLWDVFEKKSYFFLTNALLTAGAFIIILILMPWLKRVYNEYVN
ncbi:peptide MFS transporter [Carboxylicivirga caseinilyticus]|uniref:peptide MFS transporter n=1 Tax=Carboxylicivirga caseinilyticus TaxID=3417572 RepID=UPI003D3438A2|nr:peptide MFS transporter [Marinilabiliaceae bacterium A049]